MADVLRTAHVRFEPGCDLLDRSGLVIGNIDHLLDAQDTEISRDSTKSVQGAARFALSEPLDWARVLLAPSLTAIDLETQQQTTWRMGTFVPRLPERPIDKRSSLVVDGYDVTDLMTGDMGQSWSFPANHNIGTVVAGILDDHFPHLDYEWPWIPFALSNSPTWAIDEKASWLEVANELLRAAGYVALHSDRRGILTTYPVAPLDATGPVWRFDTRSGENRWIHPDSRADAPPQEVPNRWVGIWDQPGRRQAPVVGNGIAVVNNTAGGPYSQTATGRVRTKVHKMSAASQATLELATLGMAKLDSQQAATVEISCDPTPVLWHADTVAVNLPEIDIRDEIGVAVAWDMKLDGSTMRVKIEMPLFDGNLR